MLSFSFFSCPKQLKRTGICICEKATDLNFSRRASPAGCISAVWNAPLTFSGRQRFAPAVIAAAAALSTAALSPPMTSCPGQL